MSLPIVRKFVASVEAAALGVKVVKGVRPDQQLVKVVNDELVRLMGGQQEDLVDPKDGPQARPVTRSLLRAPAILALLPKQPWLEQPFNMHTGEGVSACLARRNLVVVCKCSVVGGTHARLAAVFGQPLSRRAGHLDGGPARRRQDDRVRQAGARAAQAQQEGAAPARAPASARARPAPAPSATRQDPRILASVAALLGRSINDARTPVGRLS